MTEPRPRRRRNAATDPTSRLLADCGGDHDRAMSCLLFFGPADRKLHEPEALRQLAEDFAEDIDATGIGSASWIRKRLAALEPGAG